MSLAVSSNKGGESGVPFQPISTDVYATPSPKETKTDTSGIKLTMPKPSKSR
jgi:hypothetical protein